MRVLGWGWEVRGLSHMGWVSDALAACCAVDVGRLCMCSLGATGSMETLSAALQPHTRSATMLVDLNHMALCHAVRPPVGAAVAA